MNLLLHRQTTMGCGCLSHSFLRASSISLGLAPPGILSARLDPNVSLVRGEQARGGRYGVAKKEKAEREQGMAT